MSKFTVDVHVRKVLQLNSNRLLYGFLIMKTKGKVMRQGRKLPVLIENPTERHETGCVYLLT